MGRTLSGIKIHDITENTFWADAQTSNDERAIMNFHGEKCVVT